MMRTETDALGQLAVADEVYWGSQTQRAIENFPISGRRFPPALIHAIAAVKSAAAQTNVRLGVLDSAIGEPVIRAAKEAREGQFDDQFQLDVFQAGAGTSFNMNANEVIANRALELVGEPKGSYARISPNDQVNMSQSTNDVFPTALRVAGLWTLSSELYPALELLKSALDEKGREFDDVVKAGRTHLQDAVPIRLGQEFAGYAVAIGRATAAVRLAEAELRQINIGATAVGTGINTPPGYQELVIERLSQETGLPLRKPESLIEITQSAADFCQLSSALRTLALEMIRIANDLRLLSSGPRTGLAEIKLPAVQPGSSIMPGKVNPSIAEMVDMVGFQVVGNDATIALATQAGQLELNVMLPVIAHNLLESIQILASASRVLAEKCVSGITADRDLLKRYAESSEALVTVLSPHIGYLKAAEVAKESLEQAKTIREVVLDRGLMSQEELDRLLDLRTMTG